LQVTAKQARPEWSNRSSTSSSSGRDKPVRPQAPATSPAALLLLLLLHASLLVSVTAP
jgi:hypothetical protein